MDVTKNGKTLYHIQNMNICSDGEPFDVFVFTDHFPTESDLRELYSREFPDEQPDDDSYLDEFLTSSNIYTIVAEEL